MKNFAGIGSLTFNESSGLMLADGADYVVEAVEEFERLRRSSPK
jgi:hypothetical protein